MTNFFRVFKHVPPNKRHSLIHRYQNWPSNLDFDSVDFVFSLLMSLHSSLSFFLSLPLPEAVSLFQLHCPMGNRELYNSMTYDPLPAHPRRLLLGIPISSAESPRQVRRAYPLTPTSYCTPKRPQLPAKEHPLSAIHLSPLSRFVGRREVHRPFLKGPP